LLADGRVLVTGGGNARSSAEIYDPAANSWTAAASMVYAQSSGTATRLLNGTVLVVGQGYNDLGEPVSGPAKAQIYDPTTNSWSAAPDLNFAHSSFTATLLPNGAVFVLGGFTQGEGELYQ
jgi:N-acetylneuraminic acid mutarotase